MREFFMVFRSRSEAVRFYEGLTSYRIPAKLINTPSSASVGCGLSVKCLVRYLPNAMQILDRSKLNSYLGRFYIGENGSAVRF